MHKPVMIQLALLVVMLSLGIESHAENCSSICSKKGLDLSWCDGTAPFCKGECKTSLYDGSTNSWDAGYSSDFITCAGHCSDGSGCWSGHKYCSCAEKVDCEQACRQAADTFSQPYLYESKCYSGTYLVGCVTLTGSPELKCDTRVVGWCDSSEICYCTYANQRL